MALPKRMLQGGTAGAAAMPALLAVVLYGRHLGEGFLADDFLYASWARQGIGALLRHVTVASSPQMIRPLPGLAWMLSTAALGAALLHGVSLLLHAANGLLVAAIVGRGPEPSPPPAAAGGRGAAWRAPVFAALFVAFPLFTEPVLWMSASFDLWACCFGLAAVYVVVRGDGGRAAAGAAGGLFLMALLCKESVICLPLILPLLLPWARVRRAAGAMAAVAGAYVAVRLALFAGPGGYLGDGGNSLLWSAGAAQLKTLALRIPFRVLVPFKRAAGVALAQPLCGLASAGLVAGFLLQALGPAISWRRGPRRTDSSDSPTAPVWSGSVLGSVRRFLPAALASLLALLPAVPFLTLEIDQEGSRLLYFPVAVIAVALGLRTPFLTLSARRIAVALVVYWGAATVWNGRPWTQASWEVEQTLAAMASQAPRFPPRALVFVAGHDTWQGAFTWRNGIAHAARWRGLRPDLRWFLGTAASIDSPGGELGKNLFEIGIDEAGRPVEWTACERALLEPPRTVLASWELRPPYAPARDRDPVTSQAILAHPVEAIQVRLELASVRPAAPVPGRLFWLPPAFARFNNTESAPFFLGPRAAPEIVLRVPPELAPRPPPLSTVQLWIHLPPAALSYVRSVRIAELPALCSRAAVAARSAP